MTSQQSNEERRERITRHFFTTKATARMLPDGRCIAEVHIPAVGIKEVEYLPTRAEEKAMRGGAKIVIKVNHLEE